MAANASAMSEGAPLRSPALDATALGCFALDFLPMFGGGDGGGGGGGGSG